MLPGYRGECTLSLSCYLQPLTDSVQSRASKLTSRSVESVQINTIWARGCLRYERSRVRAAGMFHLYWRTIG
jgi:hypothetical protein